jgi:hypothetical protein
MNDGSECHHAPGVRSRGVRGSDESSRETSAPLGATVLEHGATSASAHAGAETMLLGTALVVWLKSTLHNRPPSGTRFDAIPGGHELLRVRIKTHNRTWQGYGLRVTRGNHENKPVRAQFLRVV